jgi:hypothetical protein
LTKACEVAGIKKLDGEPAIGEEGWFEILEFLQKMKNKCSHLIKLIPTKSL